MHHAVQGVEGRGDGELSQALPPGVWHLRESCCARGLGLGGRTLGLGGPVALGGLQELLGSAAGLQGTARDGMGFQKLQTQHSPRLLCSPLPCGSRDAGRVQVALQVIFKILGLCHLPHLLSATNSGCKIPD